MTDSFGIQDDMLGEATTWDSRSFHSEISDRGVGETSRCLELFIFPILCQELSSRDTSDRRHACLIKVSVVESGLVKTSR